MALQKIESVHSLSGDWTITGVVGQLNLLSSSLSALKSAGKKSVHIDCGKIHAIDMSGLQLIHAWMELVEMRGINTELINLPEHLHQNSHRYRAAGTIA